MLNGPRGYLMQTEKLGHLKIPKKPTGNPTSNLPPYGAVPQLCHPSSQVYETNENLTQDFSKLLKHFESYEGRKFVI